MGMGCISEAFGKVQQHLLVTLRFTGAARSHVSVLIDKMSL